MDLETLLQSRATEAEQRLPTMDYNTEYKLPPVGSFKAQLVKYIELGNHRNAKYPESKPRLNYVLGFYLYGKNDKGESATCDDGRPMVIYTPPINLVVGPKANHPKLMQKLLGDPNLSPIRAIGKGYMLDIIHVQDTSKKIPDTKVTFANIVLDTISHATKVILDGEENIIGSTPLKMPTITEEDIVIFEWANPTAEDFKKISPNWKNKMLQAINFQHSKVKDLFDNPDAPNTRQQKPTNEKLQEEKISMDEALGLFDDSIDLTQY